MDKKLDQKLNELVAKLRAAAENNLKSVVLYGSAAAGDFHPRYSDLNIICVLGRLGDDVFKTLRAATAWWVRKGNPVPLVFTQQELLRAADMFAIELLDIKAHRRVLFGEDVFAALDVPMDLHHLQVERELRHSLVRLRQVCLSAFHHERSMTRIMTESISTFIVLFRHALIALGEDPPQPKREVIERLGTVLRINMDALLAALDLREGTLRFRKKSGEDIAETLAGYHQTVMCVVQEVDRRLEGYPPRSTRELGD